MSISECNRVNLFTLDGMESFETLFLKHCKVMSLSISYETYKRFKHFRFGISG